MTGAVLLNSAFGMAVQDLISRYILHHYGTVRGDYVTYAETPVPFP